MKFTVNTLVAAMLVATTGVPILAATRPHSNTLRVETPENDPVLAEANAQAIYLHKTNDGRAILYIEQQQGRGLSVLDVTDPAAVRRIAQISLPTGLAFEFVRDIDDNAVLIRYNDGSGCAVLNFKHSQRPFVQATFSRTDATYSERIGETGMLATVTANSATPAGNFKTYDVVDTSNVSRPSVLATVPEVEQRAENTDTGTLFLLNKDGVTMVRRLRIEAETQDGWNLLQERGN